MHWLAVKGPLESCRTNVGGRAIAFRAGQLQHTLEVTALHSTTLSGSLCDLLRRGQGSRIAATAKKCPGYPALVGGHMLINFCLPSEFLCFVIARQEVQQAVQRCFETSYESLLER